MPEQIDNITTVLFQASSSFSTKILAFLPNVIASVVIFLVGLLIARLARAIVNRLLKMLNFNNIVTKTGLESIFSSTDYQISVSSLVAGTVYWLIILLMITEIAELLHLKVISDLFERLVLYVPNLMLALAILIIGTFFARIVNRYAFNIVKNVLNMDQALSVGITVEYLVLLFVWFVALEQLRINTVLLLIVISTIVISVALAAAIAFGLAGREHAARILDRTARRLQSGIDDEPD